MSSEQFITILTKLASTFLVIIFAICLIWKYDPIIQKQLLPRISSVDLFGVKFELVEIRLDQLTTPSPTVDSKMVPLSDQEKNQILARLKLVGIALEGRHVLWVDDNPQGQIRERNFLEAIGIGVDCAQNNDIAYKLMDAQKINKTLYDLVISDVSRDHQDVDGETGFTLLTGIRNRGYTTQVIFYTTSDLPRPQEAFAMTHYTGNLLNYVFDVLEFQGTSLPAVQTAIMNRTK